MTSRESLRFVCETVLLYAGQITFAGDGPYEILVAVRGTGHPPPSCFEVWASSGAGKSCNSMTARIASSSVRITSGAFVALLFVVTVPAGSKPTVSLLR